MVSKPERAFGEVDNGGEGQVEQTRVIMAASKRQPDPIKGWMISRGIIQRR